jgi:uncharacterized membrane protein
MPSPCKRDVIMNKALSNNVIWPLVAGYFLWVLADSFFHPASSGVSATVNVFFLTAIATLHGLRRYSLKEFLIFFVITFIVSNFYENLSILTGFPFGHYHYTEALGPKLFLVPLLIAPAYFGCGYLAWSLAHVLVGAFGNKLRAEQIWRVPLVAAFVMVMWDLTMDPIAATVQKQWIWHDGGGYFGVPFVNYLGWLLCVYTVFQLFAIYISRQSIASEQEEQPDTRNRWYWYQAAAAYATTGLTSAIPALTGGNAVIADATGQQWQTMQIYQSMALIAIFTMGFVALLSIFPVGKHGQSSL